jgi:hypothetical protein
MGKSSDKSQKAEPEAVKSSIADSAGAPSEAPKTAAIDTSLPMVESPKLGGEDFIAPTDAVVLNMTPKFDAEAAPDAMAEPADEAAPAAAPARSWRFPLLAATIALAAALGSMVGSLTASGIARLVAPESPPPSTMADAGSVMRAMKAQLAELSAMKSSLDGAVHNANTQFSAIADRLDRVERAAADPATKIAHISDTVDRLNKLNTEPETTSSIASAAAAPTEPKIVDRILEDWIVQDVHGDRALVASRYGGVFDVGTGSVLPGLGRVETVKRQDGQWVVVTARGTIVSGR